MEKNILPIILSMLISLCADLSATDSESIREIVFERLPKVNHYNEELSDIIESHQTAIEEKSVLPLDERLFGDYYSLRYKYGKNPQAFHLAALFIEKCCKVDEEKITTYTNKLSKLEFSCLPKITIFSYILEIAETRAGREALYLMIAYNEVREVSKIIFVNNSIDDITIVVDSTTHPVKLVLVPKEELPILICSANGRLWNGYLSITLAIYKALLHILHKYESPTDTGARRKDSKGKPNMQVLKMIFTHNSDTGDGRVNITTRKGPFLVSPKEADTLLTHSFENDEEVYEMFGVRQNDASLWMDEISEATFSLEKYGFIRLSRMIHFEMVTIGSIKRTLVNRKLNIPVNLELLQYHLNKGKPKDRCVTIERSLFSGF